MYAFASAIVLTLILVCGAAFHTWRMYSGFRRLVSTDLRLVELRGEIVHLDEVLTMSARLSATSGDLQWEQRYKKYEPLLDAAIKETIRLAPDAYTSAGAANTDAANLALVALETQAFDLVRQQRLEEARGLVFGSDYARHKKVYSEGMEATMKSLHDRALATTKAYADNMRTSVIAAVVILIFLVVGWASVLRRMRVHLRERDMALDDQRIAKETLELRVAERTSALAVSVEKLRDAQAQVVANARAAGMAEVAANVLHNVGNVLNSMNVSTQVADDTLKACRIGGVRKAADMLASAKADLAGFLATDKGKLLVTFLCESMANIAPSHDRAAAELAQLKVSIEHVKAIVATQQTYAHAIAAVETFELAKLASEAIRLSGKQAIEIANRVPAGLTLTSDKHRLMQILLNLISNASHAIAAAPGAPRLIEIAATALPDGRARLVVRDQGIGIDSETMKKLFRHGFTTKRGGHGFGLHSSAVAARDLGGTIHAESGGTGCGATFVVEIPIRIAANARTVEPHTIEVKHAS
jgi:signal transduction histidine kinase